MSDVPRNQWMRALTAHPEKEIIELAERLRSRYAMTHKMRPQAGLALLKMCEQAFYQTYYLGEIPVACALVQLRDENGNRFRGAAQVMSDNADLSIALAICDAVLANRLDKWEVVDSLVESGMQERLREDAIRASILARTLVDFSLLAGAESHDEA